MDRTFALALAMLVGCDADHDGLTGREERALGLDPRVADTDGDGLRDGKELALGTDPLVPDTDGDTLLDGDGVHAWDSDPLDADTDGDGYRDGDEVFEGADPVDPDSRIYVGGWPYWRDKDAIAGDLAFTGEPVEPGDQFPRLVAEDQHGDLVDLYDFASPERTGDLIVLQADFFW